MIITRHSVFFSLILTLLGTLFFLTAAPLASAQQTGPQAPTILAPLEISELRGVDKVDFRWSPVSGASGYHIVLAKDREFRHVIYENRNVSGTSYKVENLDYGTHFFRVAPIMKGGTEGPFSGTRTFIMVPPLMIYH